MTLNEKIAEWRKKNSYAQDRDMWSAREQEAHAECDRIASEVKQRLWSQGVRGRGLRDLSAYDAEINEPYNRVVRQKQEAGADAKFLFEQIEEEIRSLENPAIDEIDLDVKTNEEVIIEGTHRDDYRPVRKLIIKEYSLNGIVFFTRRG